MTGLLMKRIVGLVPLLVAMAVPALAARIAAPVNGGRISDGPVHVIGRLDPGQEKAGFLLDGKPVAGLKREGMYFHAALSPAAGKHKFEVTGAGKGASVSFIYGGDPSSSGNYRYHQPTAEGKCAECHGESLKEPTATAAQMCYRCHGMPQFTYWHGPVCASECTLCHDSHGSVDRAMLRQDERKLCISCHDQPSSQKHIDGEKSECRVCHDPHGSNDSKFFVRKRK